MATVFVLDTIGYDQRGGNARVFTSLEAAQAFVPGDVEWESTDYHDSRDAVASWMEKTDDTLCDRWVIIEAIVDPRALEPWSPAHATTPVGGELVSQAWPSTRTLPNGDVLVISPPYRFPEDAR